MKRSMIIISFLCLMIMAEAQDLDPSPREDVQLGFKLGINHSNVWDAQGQDFVADPKFGFVGGFFLGVPLSRLYGVQPEVLVSQKGFKGSGTLLGSPYSFTRTTTYLDFPLQLQFKPANALTILLGPQYSYLLNKKDKYTFGSNSTEQEEAFVNDNVRKNMLGFVFGADVMIKNIVASGRFGWDLQSNNGDGTSYTPRYRNQWLQLTLGVII